MAEQLPVRYEDDEVAVVSKPPGLTAHPSAGQKPSETLASQLVKRWPSIKSVGPADRHGLVHRLDKDTSGLVLAAKTTRSFEALTKQFADRTVKKRYVALVCGVPSVPRGRIDAPVGRHYAKGEQMTVHPDGRTAETTYETTESFKEYALLDVWPSTGRTHQIRVHLAALGHPVAGDTTYGSKQRPAGLGRQFLHAAELSFNHPVTGKRVTVKDPLPADLENFLKGLT